MEVRKTVNRNDGIIGEEGISKEEAEELDKLAKETREKGVEWEMLKARLNL